MKTYSGKETIFKSLPDILFDESRFTSGIPDKVYFPQTPADIQCIVREAAAQHTPVTLIGAQTGITGGSVPIDHCIAICFSSMNRILRIEPQGNGGHILICQPGITLQEISRFLTSPGNWPYAVEGMELLGPATLFYPLDPTEMTAQLGGTVATNASGARSFHFGPTRNYVESLLLVFASGDTALLHRGHHSAHNGAFTILTDQRNTLSIKAPEYQSPEIKNASGYYSRKGMDVMDLFIGSEGTLAIYAEIGIRLLPMPQLAGGLSFFPGRKEALAFASFLRGVKNVAAIEYFNQSALSFVRKDSDTGSFKIPAYPKNKTDALYWEYLETPSSAFEVHIDKWETELAASGGSFEDTWSGFEKNEIEFLKQFRHRIPESINAAIARYKSKYPSVRKISTDTALPEKNFVQTIENYIGLAESSQLEYVLFGHLGDFHLHLNLLPHNSNELEKALRVYNEIMDLTINRGGTVSAEHGIGKIKTSYLRKMYGEHVLQEMMRVKSELDPQWLLNPGNLFEPPK